MGNVTTIHGSPGWGERILPPLRGFDSFRFRSPTAYAVGYMLSPLPGLTQHPTTNHRMGRPFSHAHIPNICTRLFPASTTYTRPAGPTATDHG